MTLVRRLTSPSDRSSRFVLRHRGGGGSGSADARRARRGRRRGTGPRRCSRPCRARRPAPGAAACRRAGGRLVECLPVGPADALALAFGQLGQQVAHAVHGAVLAVRGRPALLDGLDQPGGAVGHRSAPAPRARGRSGRARAQAKPRGTRASQPSSLSARRCVTWTPSANGASLRTNAWWTKAIPAPATRWKPWSGSTRSATHRLARSPRGRPSSPSGLLVELPDRVDDGVGELAPGGVVQLDRRPRRRLCELYYARIFEGYDPARRTSAEQAIQAARRSEGRPMDVIRGETNACD